MRTTICQAAPRTQLRRGAAVGVSDPGDGSFPLKWLLPGQPAWGTWMLGMFWSWRPARQTGEKQKGVGSAGRGQAVEVGCERGLPVGERSWGRVRASSSSSTCQPVGGNTMQAFFSPFALLLSGNYPTDSFTLPANAWLKPAKHPLALKFQNLQGYAGNREPAKKEKKNFLQQSSLNFR